MTKETFEKLWEAFRDANGYSDSSSAREGFKEGFRMGREAGINEAAEIIGHYEQGTLEMVNSGDATMREIYPELKKLHSIEKSIRALLAGKGES